MLRAHTLLVLLAGVAAQKGSAYRCRDSHQSCALWASRGECTSNYDYMAMNCPVSCELCGNAGLHPTPAWWQFDYVCDGRLAVRPRVFPERHLLRPGCTFHCRDNMTACSSAAASGACESSAELMRFQCPASCGVCKGLRMEAATSETYPKYPCTVDTGDDPEHQANCPSWVAANECVKNFGFMSKSCEESCGLCSTSAPRLAAAAERAHSTKRTMNTRGRGESPTVSASAPATATATGKSQKAAHAKETGAEGTDVETAGPALEARRAATAEPARDAANNARAGAGAAADGPLAGKHAASIAGEHGAAPKHAEPAPPSEAAAATSKHTDDAAAKTAKTGSTDSAGTDGGAKGGKPPSKEGGMLNGVKRAWGAAVNKFKKKVKTGEEPGKAEL